MLFSQVVFGSILAFGAGIFFASFFSSSYFLISFLLFLSSPWDFFFHISLLLSQCFLIFLLQQAMLRDFLHGYCFPYWCQLLFLHGGSKRKSDFYFVKKQ